MKRTRHTYTVEEVCYIRDNYAEMSASAIAAALCVPQRSIYSIARRMGLSKSTEWKAAQSREAMADVNHGGRAYQFKPGHQPENKGRPQHEWMTPEGIAASTRSRFKVGNRPANYRPVGSERVNIYGYLEVKVREGINGWRAKHKVVWEQHNGPVPRGMKIRFRDNNPHNCDIDNLYLVTAADLMRENTFHNYPDELRDIVYLRSRIKRESNKQKREIDGKV